MHRVCLRGGTSGSFDPAGSRKAKNAFWLRLKTVLGLSCSGGISVVIGLLDASGQLHLAKHIESAQNRALPEKFRYRSAHKGLL